MPEFRFCGLTETVFPFDRDALGQPLGTVQPGDVRDLGKPLDWRWVPAGDTPAGSEDEPASQDSGAAEGDAPARTRTRKAATPDETGPGETEPAAS